MPTQGRNNVHKLKLIAAIAAMMLASPALSQEITVWDVNVDEPSHATYYDHAKSVFEAAHPGAKLTFLSQPDAEYYTLLGTALASKAGPDVIWANGGAQAKALVGGLIPLDDKLPELVSKLVGKSAFTGPDGKQYVAVYSGIGGWMGAAALPSVSTDDPYAALGVVGTMRNIKSVTQPGDMLYVFTY